MTVEELWPSISILDFHVSLRPVIALFLIVVFVVVIKAIIHRELSRFGGKLAKLAGRGVSAIAIPGEIGLVPASVCLQHALGMSTSASDAFVNGQAPLIIVLVCIVLWAFVACLILTGALSLAIRRSPRRALLWLAASYGFCFVNWGVYCTLWFGRSSP